MKNVRKGLALIIIIIFLCQNLYALRVPMNMDKDRKEEFLNAQIFSNDGRLNVWKLEKLLGDIATKLIREDTGLINLTVKSIFIGSTKYLCDREGLLPLGRIGDIEYIFMVPEIEDANYNYSELWYRTLTKAMEFLSPSRDKEYEILHWTLQDIEPAIVFQDRFDLIVNIVGALREFTNISDGMPISQGDADKIAKRYIQLAYYLGSLELHDRLLGDFLKIARDDIDSIIKLAQGFRKDVEIRKLVDFLNSSKDEEVSAAIEKKSQVILNGGDPKFYTNGGFKPFHGLTVVAKILPDTQLNTELSSVQKKLELEIANVLIAEGLIKDASEVNKYFRFLPTDSSHLTISTVDPGSEYNKDRKPFVKITKEQFDRRMKEVGEAFSAIGSSLGQVLSKIKGVELKDIGIIAGQKDVIDAKVEFSEEELKKIESMIDAIVGTTGSKLRPFPSHVTFAYKLNDPGSSARAKIKKIIERYAATYIGEFVIGRVDFTYFANMGEYTTLLSLDLATGEISREITGYNELPVEEADFLSEISDAKKHLTNN